jgi:8-oxo-dGTP diphosphatase
MMAKREYPDRPVVGVGGVVILGGRALLIRRGSEPLKGQWSIPGGSLELGETIAEGVRRELHEETGLNVRVLELIEAFERIFPDPGAAHAASEESTQPQGRVPRPQYHFVILDYLCEAVGGKPRPGGDVTDVALVHEEDLGRYHLTAAATRVIRKAFAMARARAAK